MSELTAISLVEQRAVIAQDLHAMKLLDDSADSILHVVTMILMAAQVLFWVVMINLVLNIELDVPLEDVGYAPWAIAITAGVIGVLLLLKTTRLSYSRQGAEEIAKRYAATYNVDQKLQTGWEGTRPGRFQCTFDGLTWVMHVHEETVIFSILERIEGMDPNETSSTDLGVLSTAVGLHRTKPYRLSLNVTAGDAMSTDQPDVSAEAPSATTES